jgi:hypothetical protein
MLAGLTALLLAGLVTLALRILLLLAGFLAAALLLTGVLALLARILVLLVRHVGKLPCWTSELRQRRASILVAIWSRVPRTRGTGA